MERKEDFHLEGLRRGDLDSFRWIYECYHHKVHQYCFRFVRNKEVADEVTSDVFVRLWEKREQLTAEHSISGFLYKITRDYSIDHLRKATKDLESRELFFLNYKESIRQASQDMTFFEEYMGIIDRAINSLPPKRQEVFRLRYKQEMSNQQIAEKLSISPETVKVHLKKASKQIRHYLRDNSDIAFLMLAYLLK